MKRKKEKKELNKKLQDVIDELKKEKKQARIIAFKNGQIVVLTEDSEEKNRN